MVDVGVVLIIVIDEGDDNNNNDNNNNNVAHFLNQYSNACALHDRY